MRERERAERFTTQCQLTIGGPEEMERARRDGWRETPQEALKFAHGLDDDIAKAAAHRAYEDRNMSEKAKTEIQAAEDGTSEQVAEVVATPIKRRGRPRKVQPQA